MITVTRWRTPVAVLAVLAGTFLLLHTRLQRIEDSPRMAAPPWALQVAAAHIGTVSDGFPALGRVESADDVRLIAQIAGTIEQVGPRAGVDVEPGDLLVELDTRDLKAQAASMEAKIAAAQSTVRHDLRELEREKSLLAEGGSSESAVEQWETRYRADLANERALRKQLASIRIKISYGRVLAPMKARIAERLVDRGDTVTVGQPLYHLTSDSGGRVAIPVPQDIVVAVVPGTSVELRSGNETMRVAVSRVFPSLDELSMGRLEIDLPRRPFGLPDGAHLAARVVTQLIDDAVVIPRTALVPASADNERIVFKVSDSEPHRLQRTGVKIALCGLEGCAVQSGLSDGDPIVVANGNVLLLLHDGDPVTISSVGSTTP